MLVELSELLLLWVHWGACMGELHFRVRTRLQTVFTTVLRRSGSAGQCGVRSVRLFAFRQQKSVRVQL